MPVIDADTRGHLASAEHRLVNHILGEQNRHGRGYGAADRVDTYRIDWAPVIDESFELHNLRNQVQIDRCRILSHYRLYL